MTLIIAVIFFWLIIILIILFSIIFMPKPPFGDYMKITDNIKAKKGNEVFIIK